MISAKRKKINLAHDRKATQLTWLFHSVTSTITKTHRLINAIKAVLKKLLGDYNKLNRKDYKLDPSEKLPNQHKAALHHNIMPGLFQSNHVKGNT